MLSQKPWKLEAVARLFLSVFLCVYAGALILTALQFGATSRRTTFGFYATFGSAMVFVAATLLQLRRSWSLDTAIRRLIILLVCFYAGFVLGAWAQKLAGPSFTPSVTQMIVAALSFQGAAIVLVRGFLRDHAVGWWDAFGFRNRWQQALLFGLILACLFLPLGWTLQWVSAKVMLQFPRLHLKPEEQQSVQTLQMAATWASRLALGVITILLAPLAEEILFRGILYPWLKQVGFPRLALWGTALLFAAVHVNLVTFVPLAVLALALTLLYERTDNLLAPITAHALFNGFNFALLYMFQESLDKMQ